MKIEEPCCRWYRGAERVRAAADAGHHPDAATHKQFLHRVLGTTASWRRARNTSACGRRTCTRARVAWSTLTGSTTRVSFSTSRSLATGLWQRSQILEGICLCKVFWQRYFILYFGGKIYVGTFHCEIFKIKWSSGAKLQNFKIPSRPYRHEGDHLSWRQVDRNIQLLETCVGTENFAFGSQADSKDFSQVISTASWSYSGVVLYEAEKVRTAEKPSTFNCSMRVNLMRWRRIERWKKALFTFYLPVGLSASDRLIFRKLES